MKEQKTKKVFSVIYEKASEGGFIVSVPNMRGCYSQGETLEEAQKNIREAIELYLEETTDTTSDELGAFIGTVLVHA